MRPARLLRAGLLASIVFSSPLGAQGIRVELDVNASRLQFDTVPALNAPSASGALEWQGGTLLARLGGSATLFEGGTESFQGRADVAGWFSPAGSASPLRLEIGAGAGGTTTSTGFDSFVAGGDARLHLMGRRAGAWAGVGVSTSENAFDVEAVSGLSPNVGGWVQLGPTRVVARYLDTRVEGERFPEFNLSALLGAGPVDLTAYAGYRDSPFETVPSDAWAGASASYWFDATLAVTLSGGRYAPDLLQGLPGGEFLSLGVRFAPQRRRTVVPDAPLPLVFTLDDTRNGQVAFRLPDAGSVEVAGDWNGWEPTPLIRAGDGRWRLPDTLEPGVYRFNLLVDGDRWLVPEGIPTVDDGFGGTVGLLVISGS